MKKTLLSIPEDLLGDVQKASRAPTKSKAVTIAMEEYLRNIRLNHLMGRAGQGFGFSLNRLLKLRTKS